MPGSETLDQVEGRLPAYIICETRVIPKRRDNPGHPSAQPGPPVGTTRGTRRDNPGHPDRDRAVLKDHTDMQHRLKRTQ
jgi:hypothetical protein